MPSKQSSRPKLQPRTLLTGLAFGESPRWRHDRLWISDWGAREIIAVDSAGKSEVMARAPSFPSCIDFLRDGRLLMVSAYDGLLLRRQPDGSVVTHADLTGLSHHPWNDIVVDGRDNAYVNKHRLRSSRRREVRTRNHRRRRSGWLNSAGCRWTLVRQRYSRDARQFNADRRRVLRQEANRIRHCC